MEQNVFIRNVVNFQTKIIQFDWVKRGFLDQRHQSKSAGAFPAMSVFARAVNQSIENGILLISIFARHEYLWSVV